MTIVLETRAEYDADSDTVQVAIILQDPNGTSLAPNLSSGAVYFRNHDLDLFTVLFGPRNVRLIEDAEVYRDIGQFHCFLQHPVVQRGMNVKVQVDLLDGSTATRVAPVEATTLLPRNFMQNPSLAGVPTPDFPREVDKP